MATFKNFKDLETYIKQNLAESMLDSMELERELATTMSEAVHDVVYVFETTSYARREDDGGLSDPRNGVITDVKLEGDKVVLVFENITKGQTHQSPIYGNSVDSLDGQYIGETIEKGIKKNWYSARDTITAPRPFMKETADRINQNPEKVIAAIKQELQERGFKFEK